MRVLSLDLSTHTGWAFFENKKLISYGVITLDISGFDINGKPEKNPQYPFNFITRAEQLASSIETNLINKYKPNFIVIENTILGRNRHAQRLLEFIHYAVLKLESIPRVKIIYMNPSEWRALLSLRLTKEQKKHNVEVKTQTAKGKITKKHLSVEYINKTFGLTLRLKDNDIADAIGLASAYLVKEGKFS